MHSQTLLKDPGSLPQLNSYSNLQPFVAPIVSNLKNKIVIINGVEWCSYFEDYETNWDGTSNGVPIYCNGELIKLDNGDIICGKCYNRHLVFLYIVCRIFKGKI